MNIGLGSPLVALVLLSQDPSDGQCIVPLDGEREMVVTISGKKLKEIGWSLGDVEAVCLRELEEELKTPDTIAVGKPLRPLKSVADVQVRPLTFLPTEELKTLASLITDKDPLIARQGVFRLYRLRGRARNLTSLLLEHLKATHSEAVLDALKRIGPQAAEAIPLLLSRMISEEGYLYDKTLSAIGAPAVPELLKILTTGEVPMRKRAAIILSDAGPEGIRALSQLTTSPDLDLRMTATRSLREVQDPVVIPVLIPLLKDKDALIRAEAARGLAWHKKAAASAVPDLLLLLRNPDLAPKQAAAAALGTIRPDDPAVVAALIEQLRIPEAQDAVLLALIAYGPEAAPAVPMLHPILDTGKDQLLENALKLVAAIGQAAAPCLPQLTVLIGKTQASDPRGLRSHTFGALAALGPDGASAVETILSLPAKDISPSACSALGQIGPAARKGLPFFIQHYFAYGSGGFVPGRLICDMGAIDLGGAIDLLRKDLVVRLTSFCKLPAPAGTYRMKVDSPLARTPSKMGFKTLDFREDALRILEEIRVQATDLRAALQKRGVQEFIQHRVDEIRNRARVVNVGDPVERVIALLGLPQTIDEDGALQYRMVSSSDLRFMFRPDQDRDRTLESVTITLKDKTVSQIARSLLH